ncbi:MAG: flavin reductase family protein [Quisquiliibacterium sp.]
MSRLGADAQRALRNVMGTFPTGVTVITATGPDGRLIGLTVNSFSSVSLDPPLVLWSLARSSPNLEQFPVGKAHLIHVLADHQSELALQFANPRSDKWAGVDYQVQEEGGPPCIDGCVARLFCQTESLIDGGDHMVILSRVIRHESSERAPLVFYRGGFLSLGE